MPEMSLFTFHFNFFILLADNTGYLSRTLMTFVYLIPRNRNLFFCKVNHHFFTGNVRSNIIGLNGVLVLQ